MPKHNELIKCPACLQMFETDIFEFMGNYPTKSTHCPFCNEIIPIPESIWGYYVNHI